MADLKVEGETLIHSSPQKIWRVLTEPDYVKQYTGSLVQTDWKEGAAIAWTGEMHGVSYKNKGHVIKIDQNQLLKYSFWSGMGGDADSPENYSEITFSIEQSTSNAARLTYLREKIPTEIEMQIFNQHIHDMLAEIKRLAEE